MMMSNLCVPLLLITLTMAADAQWDLQNGHTDANLRGIVNVSSGVVWASGTNGTVIQSTDEGATWRKCAPVPGAEKLDFRGIQAWDDKVAIVMSAGTGDDSRLYKTTDSCKSWKLVFINPDKEGFWDTLHRVSKNELYILGDPVDGKFSLFVSTDSGQTWSKSNDAGLESGPGGGAFAASNTSLTSVGRWIFFGGAGVPAARIYYSDADCPKGTGPVCWGSVATAMATGTSASGIFSIAGKASGRKPSAANTVLVAVGGTYNRAGETKGTATYSLDGGRTWTMASIPPHGYLSCVAYDAASGAWIAVGTNGTDVSSDDGRTWRGVGSDATISDNWNALSLPFAVGPKGRIGKLKRGMAWGGSK